MGYSRFTVECVIPALTTVHILFVVAQCPAYSRLIPHKPAMLRIRAPTNTLETLISGMLRTVRTPGIPLVSRPLFTPGITEEQGGSWLEGHRNPLQKAVVHKDTAFLKHYYSLTKTVRGPLSHRSDIPDQTPGYSPREGHLSLRNNGNNQGKSGNNRLRPP